MALGGSLQTDTLRWKAYANPIVCHGEMKKGGPGGKSRNSLGGSRGKKPYRRPSEKTAARRSDLAKGNPICKRKKERLEKKNGRRQNEGHLTKLTPICTGGNQRYCGRSKKQ